MATIVTATGLSTTITGLSAGVTYYYQITAINNSTRGDPSVVQSNATAPASNSQFVVIGGKLFYLDGKLAEY